MRDHAAVSRHLEPVELGLLCAGRYPLVELSAQLVRSMQKFAAALESARTNVDRAETRYRQAEKKNAARWPT